MNYLLSFQFCLNFGNLCIYRDVSSAVKMTVAAMCFCLIEIKCLANIYHKGIMLVNVISISFATVFTLITLNTFIFASGIEGKFKFSFFVATIHFRRRHLSFRGILLNEMPLF